jgi:hypothetical protein
MEVYEVSEHVFYLNPPLFVQFLPIRILTKINGMHYNIVAIAILVYSASAFPFDSLHSRDTGLCGSIGKSCDAENAICCDGKVGFAFCNVDDQMIEFQPCKITCIMSNGIVDCGIP